MQTDIAVTRSAGPGISRRPKCSRTCLATGNFSRYFLRASVSPRASTTRFSSDIAEKSTLF